MGDDVLPPGMFPRFLNRPQAAAYLGVSARTFDAEVTAGRWPKAYRRGTKEGALTWDRFVLDRWADRLGGLLSDERAEATDRTGEEEALRRATQTDHRHKGRPPQEPGRLVKAG